VSDELFSLTLPPELVERIAAHAARLVADRLEQNGGHGFLDVPGAAAFLSCPTSRIYALVSARRIPHYRDGSRLLFDREELRNYVRNGGAKRP
jgi:excisionase family DNA binding protein